MIPTQKKHLFFIVSHEEKMKDLKYELAKESNKYKLSEELCQPKMLEENINFKIRVFSIVFDETNLKDSESEIEIALNVSDLETFTGKIKFNRKKDNFIYDFSFDILHEGKADINPPISINLSYYDKLYLFSEVLKNKFQNNESLFRSLLEDSFNLLKNDCDKYYIDFYLSLFCKSYKSSKIIVLLSYYDLEKIKLPEKISVEDISPIFEEIKEDPQLIIKYLEKDKEKEEYMHIFYNLILFYTMNYEPDKLNKLLSDRKANKYYQHILYTKYDNFKRICLENTFIDEMIKSGFEMDYEKFILTLNYLKSLEKILVLLMDILR